MAPPFSRGKELSRENKKLLTPIIGIRSLVSLKKSDEQDFRIKIRTYLSKHGSLVGGTTVSLRTGWRSFITGQIPRLSLDIFMKLLKNECIRSLANRP